MSSEVHTCVVYGRFRWARAYAWAALVNGPSRCQKLSVGTLFGVGICSCCRAPLSAFAGLCRLLFECARRCRNFPRTSMWRRSAVRQGAQTAI